MALLLALLLSISSGTPPAEEPGFVPLDASFAVSTRLDRIGRVVAPVMINGQGPFRLVVDTGASRSALAPSALERLGLQPEADAAVIVHGVTGSAQVPLVRIATLEFGALRQQDLQLPVLQSAVAGESDGLLGIEGFKGKRLVIDFEHDRVEIVDGRRPFDRSPYLRVPARPKFGGLLVIDARVGPVRTRAVVDTGAQRTLGNLPLLEALRRAQRQGELRPAIVIGATAAEQSGDLAAAPLIRLGDAELSRLEILYADLPIFAFWGLAEQPALLIGMDTIGTLRQMIVDYRRNEILLRP